jgi:hypothetical protein
MFSPLPCIDLRPPRVAAAESLLAAAGPERAPEGAADLDGLAARLDELDAQLRRLQRRDSSFLRPTRPAAQPSEDCDECAAWPWAAAAAARPPSPPASEPASGSVSSAPSARGPWPGGAPASRARRRHDPVARHEALRRAWTRDRFLAAGGGRESRRPPEGFAAAFAALHAAAGGRR